MTVTDKLRDWLHARGYKFGDEYRTVVRAAREAIVDGVLSPAMVDELCNFTPGEGKEKSMTTTADRLFGQGSRTQQQDGKFDPTRQKAVHKKLGTPVHDEHGREVTAPSELSLAKAGAFLKFAARRAGIQAEIRQDERDLFRDMVEHDDWASFNGEPHEAKIYSGGSVKALLDDSTSGGLELAPISFDDDIIQFPLLNNELLPLVDLKPVARGRRIEGGSLGNPTVEWGVGDGTEGALFSTAALAAALDTSIWPISVHVEVGRDFLSDAGVDVGRLLVENIGQRFANELDEVIADGDGTTQPQGVMQASGVGSVAFSGTAVTVTKMLNLMFGVGKAYRAPAANNFAFCGNETSYQRARSVATGVTGDTRLVFGMAVEDYNVLGRPYKISTALSNAEIIAGAWKKYRLYRRLGMSVEWSTQGDYLQRRNLALLTVRGRFGGRVMDPSAFSVTTTAEA